MIDERAELTKLYTTPLDQFTAARNDLAARLSAEGNDEAAFLVKGLKKPSVSAWAVNQLVRTREMDVKRLLKAGEALEQAQRDVLSGKPSDFDKARREEGSAVRALRDAAKELLTSSSAAVLDRISNTFRAAASADGRAHLKQGQLSSDLEPPGFEAFTELAALETDRGAATSGSDRKAKALTDRREAAREKLKVARAEAKELDKVARAAEAAAKKASLAAAAAQKSAELAATDLQKIETDLTQLKGK